MDKKWTIGLGLLGILIVFLLLWNFAPAIQRWLASVFVDIILLLAAFAAGMALRTFRRQTPPQRRRTQRTQHHPSSKKVTTSMKKLILLIALALPALLTAQQRDWANYGRYAEANAQLTTPPAVVFMGNSITDGMGQRPSRILHGEQFRLPAESAGRSPARCSAASGPT